MSAPGRCREASYAPPLGLCEARRSLRSHFTVENLSPARDGRERPLRRGVRRRFCSASVNGVLRSRKPAPNGAVRGFGMHVVEPPRTMMSAPTAKRFFREADAVGRDRVHLGRRGCLHSSVVQTRRAARRGARLRLHGSTRRRRGRDCGGCACRCPPRRFRPRLSSGLGDPGAGWRSPGGVARGVSRSGLPDWHQHRRRRLLFHSAGLGPPRSRRLPDANRARVLWPAARRPSADSRRKPRRQGVH